MKASIDRAGTLIIVPESETEAWGLRCYAEQFISGAKPGIQFCWDEFSGNETSSNGTDAE